MLFILCSSLFIASVEHAREPLYSNSAVIAGRLQPTRAQITLFWNTVIQSMSKFFTTINVHDDFSFEIITKAL